MQETASIFGWIVLGLILLLLIKSGYAVLISIEVLQIYYMYIFILLEPRPFLELKFLDALKYLNFLFIPSFFPTMDGYTNKNYEIFLENTSFLHNCSPFIVLIGFCLILYLIISILAYKGCIKNKTIRHGAKKIKKYRLRFMIFNDAIWFTYLYTFFIAVYQFRQASLETNWDIFNIVFASFVALLYFIYTIFIIYLGNKYKNPETKLPKKWSFLKMEPNSFPMEIPLRYLRKMFICLALLIPSVDAQCILLIMTNLIFLMYTSCFMPAKSMVTNAVNITIDSSYIILAGMFYGYHRLVEKTLD